MNNLIFLCDYKFQMQIVAPSYSLKFFNWREHTYENCKKKEQTRIKKIVKNRFFL